MAWPQAFPRNVRILVHGIQKSVMVLAAAAAAAEEGQLTISSSTRIS